MPKGYVTAREVICGGCQLPFMATGSRSRFCSRKCTDKEQWDRKHRKQVVCIWCLNLSDVNYSRYFCSRKCSNRVWQLKKYYNLTVDQFRALIESQNNQCAICKSPQHDINLWNIDHDHSCCAARSVGCGKCVRGLLCRSCNLALGGFKDSKEILQSAIEYLS